MVGSLVTPLVTPYNPHNRLDFTSLKFLVEHLVRTRTKTVVLGTTVGEGDQLSLIERQKLIDRVLRYGLEPLKVFVALGTNTLDDWEAEWKMIRNLPVHGLYLTYEKLLEAGILKGIKWDTLSSLKASLMINYPVLLDLRGFEPTIHDHIEEFLPWLGLLDIVGIITDDLSLIHELTRIDKRTFQIFVHDIARLIPLLQAGGDGMFSAFNHLYGETFHTLIQLVKSGAREEAGLLYDANVKKLRQIDSEDPSIIKAVLNHLGYRVGGVRRPRQSLSPKKRDALVKKLVR